MNSLAFLVYISKYNNLFCIQNIKIMSRLTLCGVLLSFACLFLYQAFRKAVHHLHLLLLFDQIVCSSSQSPHRAFSNTGESSSLWFPSLAMKNKSDCNTGLPPSRQDRPPPARELPFEDEIIIHHPTLNRTVVQTPRTATRQCIGYNGVDAEDDGLGGNSSQSQSSTCNRASMTPRARDTPSDSPSTAHIETVMVLPNNFLTEAPPPYMAAAAANSARNARPESPPPPYMAAAAVNSARNARPENPPPPYNRHPSVECRPAADPSPVPARSGVLGSLPREFPMIVRNPPSTRARTTSQRRSSMSQQTRPIRGQYYSPSIGADAFIEILGTCTCEIRHRQEFSPEEGTVNHIEWARARSGILPPPNYGSNYRRDIRDLTALATWYNKPRETRYFEAIRELRCSGAIYMEERLMGSHYWDIEMNVGNICSWLYHRNLHRHWTPRQMAVFHECLAILSRDANFCLRGMIYDEDTDDWMGAYKHVGKYMEVRLQAMLIESGIRNIWIQSFGPLVFRFFPICEDQPRYCIDEVEDETDLVHLGFLGRQYWVAGTYPRGTHGQLGCPFSWSAYNWPVTWLQREHVYPE